MLWRALAQTDESALRISGMLLQFSLFSRRADSGARFRGFRVIMEFHK